MLLNRMAVVTDDSGPITVINRYINNNLLPSTKGVNRMKIRDVLVNMACAAGLMGVVAGAVQTRADDTGGKHPHYLHALSDLRFSRAHLAQHGPNELVSKQEQSAIDEIDAAMREIKAASIDDGKSMNDHPAIDAKLSKADRYQQSLTLLQKVENDINQEEDNQDVQGLQHRAMMHVSAAEKTVTAIIQETRPVPKHPAYLNALSDLRFARANLDKIAPSDVVTDQELQAIKEIDGAIGEIKTASIDDGKNLSDHPAIDVNLKKADRYHAALDLLNKTQADLKQEEDNQAMKDLQRRAIMHVTAAEKIVTAIIKEPHPVAKHPDYLNALADLRFARAHLDKLSPSDVANDQELRAIKEIDAAIREIKTASIDDGKALSDHPTIDVSLKKTDRYHNALDLLDKASKDVSREEDDKTAQGLQRRAQTHIQDAEKAVNEALASLLN
jgi:tetratricopeptide (TPR) repeat protein